MDSICPWNMTVRSTTNSVFTTNNEILVEVSQFISCVSNKILSQNINMARDLGITSLDSFNALLTQELDEYKVYDC